MPDEASHLKFRKSSYSSPRHQDCVEVADTPGTSAVRDTQNRHLGHIEFPSTEWAAFLRDIKADRL
ncbi:DUF397 domain-containing protein [Streptomonospora nanhaiensis]|uniref:DUF397 domain-containing protein n=1 Tax=Streptomonospora nanhaiensis TaxID=1323731 RepID=A0A853BP38_9ACTN|nr:DUF397 domain-containing protein [Streptomonospora nanhaiensis]MBV2361899.1 DUF397 domain-containing protein [Streptomonospora nanhaiensis]MBX9390535.1 DUF397 domain-containing protein [Streptomonospora nanhaiensis]NYI96281.1 hypothetical protein [Streptomonospora nanhaiensis]